MQFKPIDSVRASTYEKVVDRIKEMIFQGQLKPGDQLPPERDLALLLGVSRTSLREALKILAASGLVSIRHGQGVFIADRDLEGYMQQFAKRMFLTEDTVEDLFQVRKILESKAASWAAERATPDDIRELQEVVARGREANRPRSSRGWPILAEHDARFHHVLAHAAGNQVLLRLLENLMDLLTDARAHSLSIPGRSETSVEEHARIVEKIAIHDAAAAEQSMLQHLESVEKSMLLSFGRSPDSEPKS